MRRAGRPPQLRTTPQRACTSPSGGSFGCCGARAPPTLSPGALSALASLASGGPCRLGDLAVREGVAAPTMTRIVAVLEEAGLVRRTSDPLDGRAVVVGATDAGTALVQGESLARSSALRRRVAALPAADRAALDAALPVLEALARDDEG